MEVKGLTNIIGLFHEKNFHGRLVKELQTIYLSEIIEPITEFKLALLSG
jgi:hypothetical protein